VRQTVHHVSHETVTPWHSAITEHKTIRTTERHNTVNRHKTTIYTWQIQHGSLSRHLMPRIILQTFTQENVTTSSSPKQLTLGLSS